MNKRQKVFNGKAEEKKIQARINLNKIWERKTIIIIKIKFYLIAVLLRWLFYYYFSLQLSCTCLLSYIRKLSRQRNRETKHITTRNDGRRNSTEIEHNLSIFICVLSMWSLSESDNFNANQSFYLFSFRFRVRRRKKELWKLKIATWLTTTK